MLAADTWHAVTHSVKPTYIINIQATLFTCRIGILVCPVELHIIIDSYFMLFYDVLFVLNRMLSGKGIQRVSWSSLFLLV